MVIVTQNQGLGPGIESLGSSLGSALQQRGQYQRQDQLQNQKQQREMFEQQRQAALEQEQMSSISQAINQAQAIEGADPMARLSAFQSALAKGGQVDPKTALGFMKMLGEQQAKQDKGPVRDATDRQTLKGNQTFLAGLSADAHIARGLYKDIDKLTQAIESPDISGPGLPGEMVRAWRWMTGAGQPGDEQTMETMRKQALTKLGDLKGMRLTDTKLRFLEESLFNPKKSPEANREALRIYKEVLEERIQAPKSIQQLMANDSEALYDPALSIRLEELLGGPQGGEELETVTETEQEGGLTPQSFAEMVRKRGKKK